MKTIHVISSSLGKNQDSHAIRIANYLDREVMRSNGITLRLWGIGEGECGGWQVNDIGVCEKRTFRSFFLNGIAGNLYYRFSREGRFQGLRAAVERIIVDKVQEGDLVITASGLMASHLGALSARKEGKQFEWFADFGDPLSYVDRYSRPWFYQYTRRIEGEVAARADLVLVTTKETRDYFECFYPSSRVKVLYYGCGKEACADKNFTAVTDKSDTVLKIGHIGVAYKSNRDLRPLIKACGEFCCQELGLHLSLVGPHSGAFDRLAKRKAVKLKNFNYYSSGGVSYIESLLLMNELDLLVIVGNKSKLQIPGKCFVSLMQPKPILYIKQIVDDPFLSLTTGDASILVSTMDEKDILSKLEEYMKYRHSYDSVAVMRPISGKYESFSSINLSKKLLESIALAS